MKTFDHNVETGEITDRDMTKAEADAIKAQAELDAIEVAKGEKIAEAKEAAIAKLAALGLTDDDLKALGL